MEQNKTGKYFKYAIGEIVLVVIGILIALSINNWNEKRKDRIIESQLLDEMLISLKSDKGTFKMLEKRLTDKDSAIQRFLNLRESGELSLVKSFGNLVGLAKQKIRFSYDRSPYENLVALGINKISNKELLKAINKYYTQDIPRGVTLLKASEERYLPTLKKSEDEFIERGIIKKLFVKSKGDDKWHFEYKTDPDRLINDEKFYLSLVVEFQYMSYSLLRLRYLMEYNEGLIKLLEKNK